MPEQVLVLASADELVSFLAREPQNDRAAEFHDTVFEVYERRANPSIGVDMVRIEIATSEGWFARIWLRTPLALDLLLQPREVREPECELEARFDIAAANRPFAMRRLAPIAPILVAMSDFYDVELRDAVLEIGPLERGPQELAGDLTLLIDALATLQQVDDEPEADRAAFCHFCGHGVAEDAVSCPRCGERLVDD